MFFSLSYYYYPLPLPPLVLFFPASSFLPLSSVGLSVCLSQGTVNDKKRQRDGRTAGGQGGFLFESCWLAGR